MRPKWNEIRRLEAAFEFAEAGVLARLKTNGPHIATQWALPTRLERRTEPGISHAKPDAAMSAAISTEGANKSHLLCV